jgi:tetratricopeptide (TPR) repeat protein
VTAPGDTGSGMIAADPPWMDLAATAGHEVRPLRELTQRELRTAEAVVIGQSGAWERIRAWRSAGVPVGVVVVVEREDSPDDRPRLEPVVLLRRTDRDGFEEALARLAVGEAPARVALASGVADFHRQVFERADGTIVRLTGLEARLLAYLAARSFRVVGRDELQEQVWGYRKPLATKAVEMTVGRLRKKVEQNSLVTIRGEGYRAVRLGPRPEPESVSLDTVRTAVKLLAQHGRLDEARAMLARHEHEREPDDLRALAEARLLAARVAQEARDHAGALAAALEAAQVADEQGWPALLADASCTAASLARLEGRAEEARALASRAEGLFTAVGDEVGLARALAVQSELAPPDEGLALAARAAALLDQPALAQQLGVAGFALRANLHARLGTAHRRAGRLREALAHYETAAAGYAALGRPHTVAQLEMAAATLHGELGDDEAAVRGFARALALAPPETAPLVAAAAAHHELGRGRLAEAHAHAARAVRETPDPGAPGAVWITLTLARTSLSVGDLEGARAWLARAHDGPTPAQHDAQALRALLVTALQG